MLKIEFICTILFFSTKFIFGKKDSQKFDIYFKNYFPPTLSYMATPIVDNTSQIHDIHLVTIS